MMDAKVDSECLLRDYENNEAGLRQIKLNHLESTYEERDSESSPMDLCHIVTAVCIEDSSEEYISDELRRLIQNKTAMRVFYAGALFGVIQGMGVVFILDANFLGPTMWAQVVVLAWGTCSLLILFVERTLILNIFRASYKRRNIGNEFITHSILSFVDFKIVTGMVVGVCLNWVVSPPSGGLCWMALVSQTFPIILLIHNSITDNSIMNGDTYHKLEGRYRHV
mmetsp:Transcript_27939/g.50859  ORF Transcript_27939/g.50859 Transcript_27939/m.50859 type:complete len:224 (-) Transcript_27939:186-857(-)